MLQYLIAFSLYTLAMVGIFFIAFVVYKKTMNFNGQKPDNGIKVEDMLRLSQRKSLYIINVQGERFLIASDFENTTFLSKLAPKTMQKNENQIKENNILNHDMQKNIISSLLKPKIENEIKTETQRDTKKDEFSKKQIEKYLKELEVLDTAIGTMEETQNEKNEEDYSNAIDINSRKTIMKNILKELDNNSKRTSI